MSSGVWEERLRREQMLLFSLLQFLFQRACYGSRYFQMWWRENIMFDFLPFSVQSTRFSTCGTSANTSVGVINAEEPTISPWRTIVHEACYSSFRHTFKARECAPCDSLDSSSDFKSIELVEYIENSRFELFFEFELRNSTCFSFSGVTNNHIAVASRSLPPQVSIFDSSQH